MKIQQVKIKEFKVLKDIEQSIDGNNILLLGDNGVGKSSFIQFIEIALGKQTNIPINAQGEGEIVTDKDGNKYTFKVKFKDGKPVVTVETPDGLKDNRKSALSSIVGAIDFDIDEFVDLSKTTAGRKKQVEIFKSFLPQDVKIEIQKLENSVQVSYDERTDVNREVKRLEGVISSSTIKANELDSYKQVDVAAEMESLNKANEVNQQIERIELGIIDKGNGIVNNNLTISELESKIKNLKEANSILETEIKKGKDWLAKNSKVDTSAIQQKINDASKQNIDFNRAMELKSTISELEEKKQGSGDLTVIIDTSKQAIMDAIKDMDSPVKGLMFDSENLLYNGIPVSPDTLSTSEIMELGVKLKMAENKDFGILFLQRGESLGAKRYVEILELCKKENWQLIMEQVDRGNEKLTFEIINS